MRARTNSASIKVLDSLGDQGTEALILLGPR